MTTRKVYDAAGNAVEVKDSPPARTVSNKRDFTLLPMDAAVIFHDDGTIEGVLPAFGEEDTISVGSPSFWACVTMSLFSEHEWWVKARDTVSRYFQQFAAAQEADEDAPNRAIDVERSTPEPDDG